MQYIHAQVQAPSTWGMEIPQLSELSSPFEALRYITESLPPIFPRI